MTASLLVCFNLVTDAISTVWGYISYRSLKIDVFLSKMAGEIIMLISVGIMTNLCFQYAKLGWSSDIEQTVEARRHIKNSWMALILALSAMAIDSIIWIISAIIGVVH
jgi:hypothetical protein